MPATPAMPLVQAGAHMDKTLQAVVLGTGCLVASAAALKYYLNERTPKGCAKVRGSGWLGLLGALPEMWKCILKYEAHSELVKYHDDLGNTLDFDFGILQLFLAPMIITRDPQNVKFMLKTQFENFEKGETFHAIGQDVLGDGIFNVDGESWFKQRKTASQMFTANRFKQHIWRVVEKNCNKVISILAEQQEPVIDMFSLLNRFTLDSIGEIGFGADIGSLENPVSPFLKSFDEAQRIIFKRFVLPGWRLFRLLGLGPEAQTRRHMRALRSYSRRIVEDLAEALEKPAGDSFVGLFMKNEPGLHPEFLADLVLNFLIAGRDTTAQALSWCLFLVMQHPAVEERILEEVERVSFGKSLSYDQLSQLSYTEAVLREALRLYPSVPLDSKFVTEAMTLPDGTWVPRGSMVIYNSYAMGRSKQIWGEDAAEFRPERWLNAEPKDPYEYPVFHAGPRECLGKRLAMVEMKTVLAELLRHASFRLAVPKDQVLPDTSATLGMSSGLKCHYEMRL